MKDRNMSKTRVGAKMLDKLWSRRHYVSQPKGTIVGGMSYSQQWQGVGSIRFRF